MDLARGLVDKMNATDLDKDGLNTALTEAICLGMQVNKADARIRIPLEVLTAADGTPRSDKRVDLVLLGVGRVAASMRFHWWTTLEPEETVLPLSVESLDEAVHAFGGGCLHGWEFIDPPESSWSKWEKLLSFDTDLGTENTAHVLELTQQEGSNNRELDVRIWFTDLVIEEQPGGQQIPVQEFVNGGKKWWRAHHNSDPRTTHVWHIAPPL